MNRRMSTHVGIGCLVVVTLGLSGGCAHQRESFSWPWSKKSTALAEPPLESAARDATPSTTTAARPSTTRRGSVPRAARAHESEVFDFDAYRD